MTFDKPSLASRRSMARELFHSWYSLLPAVVAVSSSSNDSIGAGIVRALRAAVLSPLATAPSQRRTRAP